MRNGGELELAGWKWEEKLVKGAGGWKDGKKKEHSNCTMNMTIVTT